MCLLCAAILHAKYSIKFQGRGGGQGERGQVSQWEEEFKCESPSHNFPHESLFEVYLFLIVYIANIFAIHTIYTIISLCIYTHYFILYYKYCMFNQTSLVRTHPLRMKKVRELDK